MKYHAMRAQLAMVENHSVLIGTNFNGKRPQDAKACMIHMIQGQLRVCFAPLFPPLCHFHPQHAYI